MCGLFGTIRPHQYPQQIRTIASTALIDLCYLAEERGIDSAGIATTNNHQVHTNAYRPTRDNPGPGP